jgi:DNA modification methylase
LIAAERMGRRCCGMELDPLYADTIIRRWQAMTGDQARHAASGETFEARAAAIAELTMAHDDSAVVTHPIQMEADHAA